MRYLVGAGDTPSKIAAGLSGHAARMPELLAANPHKPRVGGTFASLSVGEHLRIPAGWTNRVRQAAGMSGPPTGNEIVGLGSCCDECAQTGGDCSKKLDASVAEKPETLNPADYYIRNGMASEGNGCADVAFAPCGGGQPIPGISVPVSPPPAPGQDPTQPSVPGTTPIAPPLAHLINNLPNLAEQVAVPSMGPGFTTSIAVPQSMAPDFTTVTSKPSGGLTTSVALPQRQSPAAPVRGGLYRGIPVVGGGAGFIGAVTGTADVNVQNVITQNVADAGNALLAALSNFNGVADCTNPTILGAVGAFQDAANASGLSQAVLGHSLTKDCNYGPQGAAVLGSLVVNAALAGITMTSGSAPDPLFVTGPCKMFVGCSGNVVNPTPNPPLPPSPPNVTPIINNNTAPSSNTALIMGGLALAAAAVGGVVYMSKHKKGGRRSRRMLRA